MVMATENPYEHEGTYPLPEAQKDRFLMKLLIGYPEAEEEKAMVEQVLRNSTGAELSLAGMNRALEPGEFVRLKERAAVVRVDPVIIDYAVRLTGASRDRTLLDAGAGPRGSLALIRCARARALMEGRDFVIPDDIKALAEPVLIHRITLSAESELEGLDEGRVIETLLSRVEAPRA
jgi:MoxR-like ATPase